MTSRLDVCIVTCDLVGPIRNGGIGTAYSSLAQALTRDGHRVTVLYALGRYCETGTIAEWRRSYARQGITFVALPPTNVEGHASLRMADAAYRWLKPRRFDAVHYHEWRGVGAFIAQAKHLGLAFAETMLVAGVHSPTLWQLEGTGELASAEQLEIDFMERQSVAHADVLWSPSRHMVRWLRREHWTLPRRVVVKPCILLDAKPRRPGPAKPGPELVFFGRLETRKGVDLFCDAIDRAVAGGQTPASVTFLGKAASVNGQPSEDFIRRRAKKWPFRWRILSRLDRHEAMAYLRRSNRVAVLPSRVDNLPYTVLECLNTAIPFVASDIGGIPEMIRTADHARVLFSLTPASFAARLSAIIRDGQAAVPPRIPIARTVRDWLRWHEQTTPILQARARTRRPARSRDPLVSVCITTHNRPAYLREAIASIERQDYRRLEVVVVDDGSDLPEAQRALDRLAPRFRRRGWQIVRQPNRYLGAARNAAVAYARGEYVLFMDDDNLAEPGEVTTLVRAATTSGADLVACFLSVFRDRKPRPTRPTAFVWPFLGAAVAPGLVRNVFGDANALVRRDVFARIGGFTERVGVTGEDWEFLARAVLLGFQLEVVPEALVRYRQSPTSMLHTTSARANHLRALTPYLSLLPAPLRGLAHLSANASLPAAFTPARTGTSPALSRAPIPPRTPVLDAVKRAVIFGSGEAGRLAIDLSRRCGWDVQWIVDNNPGMWNQTAHDLPVRAPASLSSGGFDLVVVASLAGKTAIAQQLTDMGFADGEQFVHFLDPVRVSGVTYQLSLP